MEKLLNKLYSGRGLNIDGSQGAYVEKSKKKGAIWATLAAVTGLAIAIFATLSVVGAALSISAFVTGAGAALGVFQLINTLTSLFMFVVLTYIMVQCVKNAHYHLGGKKILQVKIDETPKISKPTSIPPSPSDTISSVKSSINSLQSSFSAAT